MGFLIVATTPLGCRDAGLGEKVLTHRVQGSVLLKGGRPATGGLVTFVPRGSSGRQAVGAIQPDGKFTLTTEVPGDGVAEGIYKVRIEPFAAGGAPSEINPKVKVPGRFMDEDTSGIEVTIKPETAELEPFRLE